MLSSFKIFLMGQKQGDCRHPKYSSPEGQGVSLVFFAQENT